MFWTFRKMSQQVIMGFQFSLVQMVSSSWILETCVFQLNQFKLSIKITFSSGLPWSFYHEVVSTSRWIIMDFGKSNNGPQRRILVHVSPSTGHCFQFLHMKDFISLFTMTLMVFQWIFSKALGQMDVGKMYFWHLYSPQTELQDRWWSLNLWA